MKKFIETGIIIGFLIFLGVQFITGIIKTIGHLT